MPQRTQKSELPFWASEPAVLFRQLDSNANGLRTAEAEQRLRESLRESETPKHRSHIRLFLEQLKSPITIILILAALLSAALRDPADATIILTIVLISAALGYWQEYSAASAIEKLLSMVKSKCSVLRDGSEVEVAAGDVVPGDVIILSAGSAVPADCVIISSTDLYIDEATLTGETFPVEKQPGVLPPETALAKRSNTLFKGTHAVSGSAKALVVQTGEQTEFGKISKRLQLRPPETDFERGIRRFGYLLMEITMILVIVIFATNVFFKKPVIDSFLFSLALAVGLTPQLLPAIISVNLAHGARRMAQASVIVRRLASIENFGSMNVLCSDKTGTLTQGIVEVEQKLDANGNHCEKLSHYAYLNAAMESGFANPIDRAIREHCSFDISNWQKIDECPYDFVRKLLSILVQQTSVGPQPDERLLITKGAFDNVLAACSQVEVGGVIAPLEGYASMLRDRYVAFGDAGFRTLGVAYRVRAGSHPISRADESDMIFLGFLVLRDPLKLEIQNTVAQLKMLGVSLKMITGDNERVAANVAAQVGLPTENILTGRRLREMSDEALINQVNRVSVFAEVEPNQKERIILACQKAGNVVGYMGDGINDATALHAADVGISVEQAVDVAKEAADIVLLKQDLAVLVQGVREGRMTFANTMKYIFMATSANFGNMFTMATSSLFLSFLPLLPKQILLTNLLTDLPEMTIASDTVDDQLIQYPQRWDLRFIQRFMLVFGVISTLFDFLTFGILLLIFRVNEAQFRTAWFLESVISATLIVLVVRTRGSVFRSRPGKALTLTTALVICSTLIVPWSPLANILGFVPLEISMMFALSPVIVGYILTAELAKGWFYRMQNRTRHSSAPLAESV